MPGTDPAEAMAVILGELSELPHLPELPARGPGADLLGRTAALLIDLPVQTTATGWRLAGSPGRELRRAAGWLSADLDAMQAAAAGFTGTFKIQACGPWTLAASLELSRSIEPALADQGAVTDLIGSLAEGLAGHVSAVRSRLPGATVVLQLDEPALPGVLAGAVPTASGLRRVPAVDDSVAADGLRTVLAATGVPTVVHCCAPEIPFHCLMKSRTTAVSFDLSLLRRGDEDAFGEAVEAGTGMLIGVVPATSTVTATGPMPPPGAARATGTMPPHQEAAARQSATAVIERWLRIGLRPDRLSEQVVLTPACGLAGASASYARSALARCAAAARFIPELIEEGIR